MSEGKIKLSELNGERKPSNLIFSLFHREYCFDFLLPTPELYHAASHLLLSNNKIRSEFGWK